MLITAVRSNPFERCYRNIQIEARPSHPAPPQGTEKREGGCHVASRAQATSAGWAPQGCREQSTVCKMSSSQAVKRALRESGTPPQKRHISGGAHAQTPAGGASCAADWLRAATENRVLHGSGVIVGLLLHSASLSRHSCRALKRLSFLSRLAIILFFTSRSQSISRDQFHA